MVPLVRTIDINESDRSRFPNFWYDRFSELSTDDEYTSIVFWKCLDVAPTWLSIVEYYEVIDDRPKFRLHFSIVLSLIHRSIEPNQAIRFQVLLQIDRERQIRCHHLPSHSTECERDQIKKTTLFAEKFSFILSLWVVCCVKTTDGSILCKQVQAESSASPRICRSSRITSGSVGPYN